MALPRCCHGVTTFRTKLQCKAGKTKGGYKRLYCVVSCLHGGLHTSGYTSGPSIARVGSCPTGRRRWAQVVCNNRRPTCQHIGSSRECTASLAGWESPHRPHRSFSSVHCRASITALSSSLERVRDRPGRAEGFCEVVLCLVVVDARCHRQDLRGADSKTSRAGIPRRQERAERKMWLTTRNTQTHT